MIPTNMDATGSCTIGEYPLPCPFLVQETDITHLRDSSPAYPLRPDDQARSYGVAEATLTLAKHQANSIILSPKCDYRHLFANPKLERGYSSANECVQRVPIPAGPIRLRIFLSFLTICRRRQHCPDHLVAI